MLKSTSQILKTVPSTDHAKAAQLPYTAVVNTTNPIETELIIDSMPVDSSSDALCSIFFSRFMEAKTETVRDTKKINLDEVRNSIYPVSTNYVAHSEYISDISIRSVVKYAYCGCLSHLIEAVSRPPFVANLAFVYRGKEPAHLSEALQYVERIIGQLIQSQTHSICLCITMVEWRKLHPPYNDPKKDRNYAAQYRQLMHDSRDRIHASNLCVFILRKEFHEYVTDTSSSSSSSSSRDNTQGPTSISIKRIVRRCLALATTAIKDHRVVLHDSAPCPDTCYGYIPTDDARLASMLFMTTEEHRNIKEKERSLKLLASTTPGCITSIVSEAVTNNTVTSFGSDTNGSRNVALLANDEEDLLHAKLGGMFPLFPYRMLLRGFLALFCVQTINPDDNVVISAPTPVDPVTLSGGTQNFLTLPSVASAVAAKINKDK